MAVKVTIPPDKAGYSATRRRDTLSVRLDGGAGRYRRNIPKSTAAVAVIWTVGSDGYSYLQSVYRTLQGVPFLLDLVLDGALAEYTVYFVPGTFAVKSVDGLKYTVTSELEVVV